jgi:phosphatidylglycerol:prolipoprotein diacylglycerol transferase
MRHYWVDDLNPWVFRFCGNLGIRWYGVAYVVGIAFAGSMFSRWAKQKRLPISVDEAYTLPVYAAVGAVLGGRIGYRSLHEGGNTVLLSSSMLRQLPDRLASLLDG